jgi:glycerophosphoryl diester phosphodiesterase
MADEKRKGTRRTIRLHNFLALTLLVHCVFYLIYWFSVGNFRNRIDEYLAGVGNLNLPYTLIIISLTGLIGFWSLGRIIGLRLSLKKGEWHPVIANGLYLGVWVTFLVLFYTTFAIILAENPSQQGVIIHLLDISRIVGDAFLFLLAAVWLRRLILKLRRKMWTTQHRWISTTGIILILIFLVGLWLLPAVFPPNWAYKGDLPAKPALIAHRGASMLAPENTMAAIELAAEYQAFGFETDLRISQDGIPFLMHDHTLARTTNIAEVFPEKMLDRASSFSLESLKQLNAGLWFIQQDPFGTIRSGMVSQSQLSQNQGQGIPMFAEALAAVEEAGMVILFDMRNPPADHPHYDDYFEIVLSLCRESGLNEDIWFLVDWGRLPTLREEAPQLTRVIGAKSTDLPDPQRLLDSRFAIINVDTGVNAREVQSYREKGLGVNVYTIDQPWLFSQFWLSGVTSVTTNNVHIFSQIDRPSVNFPYSRYILFWGLFGIIVAIWLAGSQPVPELQKPLKMETPDLMDFAEDGELEGFRVASHAGNQADEGDKHGPSADIDKK